MYSPVSLVRLSALDIWLVEPEGQEGWGCVFPCPGEMLLEAAFVYFLVVTKSGCNTDRHRDFCPVFVVNG